MVKLSLEVNGITGTAEVNWIPTNQWAIAHYEAFIVVPFQNPQKVHLYVNNKKDINIAVAKAKDQLESALQRCILC